MSGDLSGCVRTGVTACQIAAASDIHDNHMPGWAGTDRALAQLAQSVPGNPARLADGFVPGVPFTEKPMGER